MSKKQKTNNQRPTRPLRVLDTEALAVASGGLNYTKITYNTTP